MATGKVSAMAKGTSRPSTVKLRRVPRHNEAGHGTRERLLDAAERLFADRGLDAVSVRDITDAAGANSAAVHYHFGSKQGLATAVLERRMEQLMRRRDELLDELESQASPALRDVVRATVLPTAEMAADGPGGQHYVTFMVAIGNHSEYLPILLATYDPHTERFLRTLAAATPSLPEPIRRLRFAIARDVINRVLGNPKGQIHQWLEHFSPGADDNIVAKLVDIVVGIFEAPVTTASSGSGE
jgi:AcrR family transcriptional regulator